VKIFASQQVQQIMNVLIFLRPIFSVLLNLLVVLQKYAWTGHNNFFIKGNLDSLSIGAGE